MVLGLVDVDVEKKARVDFDVEIEKVAAGDGRIIVEPLGTLRMIAQRVCH